MYLILLKTFIDFKSSFVTNVLFNFCFYLIMTMLFLTRLLFLSAYRTTATVSTANDTISTTMILLHKSNVLTIYHGDDSNDLIMNCHKSLSCNNFPTVPSRPYIFKLLLHYLYAYMYIICYMYV